MDQRKLRDQEHDLVELRRMARDAVTEIHAPRQAGGRAVGMVGQPCEKAADAADAHADGQRQHESIAAGALDVGNALGDFHAKHAAKQCADDRLARE